MALLETNYRNRVGRLRCYIYLEPTFFLSVSIQGLRGTGIHLALCLDFRLVLQCRDLSVVGEQRVFSSEPTQLWAQANIKQNHFLLIFLRMWNSYGTNVLSQWVSTEYWWIGIGPGDSNKFCQSGAGQMGSREFITASLEECRLTLTADNLPSTQSSKTLSSSSPPASLPLSPQLYLLWAARPQWWDNQYFWDDEGELMQSLSFALCSSLGSASAGREIKAERTSEMLLEGRLMKSSVLCPLNTHTPSHYPMSLLCPD